MRTSHRPDGSLRTEPSRRRRRRMDGNGSWREDSGTERGAGQPLAGVQALGQRLPRCFAAVHWSFRA